MATRTAAARLLSARLIPRASTRGFTRTVRPCYDGVYEELRLMKLQKPWLQALKERNAGIEEPVVAPQQQELVPKRMKDSYHELVSPLTTLPARPRPAPPSPAHSARFARPVGRRTLADIYRRYRSRATSGSSISTSTPAGNCD
jgi:hypothetical protein